MKIYKGKRKWKMDMVHKIDTTDLNQAISPTSEGGQIHIKFVTVL